MRPKPKRTEHGPHYESHNPGKGCNSTHVARARRKWKRRANRSERRTDVTTPKVQVTLHRRVRPPIEE
jgi:hypothetical protein